MTTDKKQEGEFEKRMREKMELAQTIDHHDIDTSNIFYGLRERHVWKKYELELIDRIEEAIHVAHKAKKVMSYCNDGSDIAQMKIQGHLKRMASERKETQESNRCPIEYYYIGGFYNKMEYIVCMDERCVVEKEGYQFDLLFAVQFSLTPIQDCSAFLTYQLERSFNNDLQEFTEFMDNMCLEYKLFLSDKHEPFYRKFLEKLHPAQERTAKGIHLTGSIKLNWHGQSNSLTYLFRQLKTATNKKGEPLLSNSYEDIASFIKSNFEGFESVKLSTLIGQLKKTDKPKKADKTVELYL